MRNQIRWMVPALVAGMLGWASIPEAQAGPRGGVSVSIHLGSGGSYYGLPQRHVGYRGGYIHRQNSCQTYRPRVVHPVRGGCASGVRPRKAVLVPTVVYVHDGCRVRRVVEYRPVYR